jgi:FtsP/CotA-like multicopper oxidase with cupredoxin domain
VPEGTEIHAIVHNALPDSALVVHGLATRGTALGGADTLRIRPGETREVRFAAGASGTYFYWASSGARTVDRLGIDSQLGGAFVVDSRGTSRPARDRVLVLSVWNKDRLPGGPVTREMVLRFAINGRSWPHTERLTYPTGDTVRFRLVNVSGAPHPMHLHGFFFDVASRGDGTVDSVYDHSGSRHLAVTELLMPGRTATIAWVPERAGNWLFHCHDNYHVARNPPIDGTPLPAEQSVHTHNHVVDMMGGLVMAIEVRPRRANAAATEPDGAPRRTMRLVARADSGSTEAEPAYGYVLHDGARTTPSTGPLLAGPTIVLKRGEPVAITVINQLAEPTSVHWHGIELESYYDGVADFSGRAGQIAPAIAPNDSFVVHFTPPRSGTFMYHPHADEMRQQQAGLAGVLLVLDDPTRYDPLHDVVLLVTVPRRRPPAPGVLLNGIATPPPLDLKVGERYRLRLADLHTFRPGLVARLLRDSTPVPWRAVAKDGADLPADQATVHPAVQALGNGETYDFELVPDAPGDLRFVVSLASGTTMVTMVIQVR